MTYEQFIASKAIVSQPRGFEPMPIPENRFKFQRDVVGWAARRGCAALFEDCGLGKTVQQLDWAQQVATKCGDVLILAPLAVSQQTVREGQKFGIEVNQVSEQSEVKSGISVTNYQKLHKFDASHFKGIVLDESSILKSFDGKYRTDLIEKFSRTPYRLACTATPAPNDYMELGNHAEFLGVMKREEMLAMFFTHDGGETSKWRLKGHAGDEFWKWMCSWSVNLRRPSDLGYDDGDFKLPPLELHEHVVESTMKMDGYLFALPASSLSERRDARKSSLNERVELAAEIANSNYDPCVAWCNLNTESESLAKAIEGAVELTGSDSDERKEEVLRGFSDGTFKRIVTKPTIAGFGLNWQHCALELFVGLSDSYEQYYQAIRRCWRFGQKKTVSAHLVISSLEGAVLANLKRKEADSTEMANQMVKHMANISSATIRGVTRDQTEYKPMKKIKLPAWV
jgi:superfamily II DNA or RNA helicase